MSSRHSTPPENDTIASQASSIASGSTLPNAFSRMMGAAPVVQSTAKRDRCARPPPQYNHNYNPFEKPSDDIRSGYSPYVYGEPLYDDRAIIVARLPRYYTAAPAAKKPRTSWVWNLGYALTDNQKAGNPTIWACKLCTFMFYLRIIITDVFRSPRCRLLERQRAPL
jgi:hypothetical protein